MDGGLELRPGQSVDINATQGWSGCFWGRRSCSFDNSGKGSCVTGDCGGVLKYAPRPASSKEGTVVACNSACMAFNKPEYCCSGAYSTPETCKPTEHSNVFKASCPTSYSYAYDDPTNTFTCKGANYLIRFC
ncbi:Pathogenesis-related protein 5 [Vitis vinifera]|uniref:Pathogenesis-related protein 5 n=1 Tax=Vitis vinifera TaxID=29760 RepID=A0A438IKF1_VITVI|nr:Pathogenesis-related protein 5 [Vitis vinifera]